MAEAKICVCPQCGKKFKVSADAAAASFACSACGATVWIDGKPKVAPGGRRSKASGARAAGGRAARGRAAEGRAAEGGGAGKGRAAGKKRGRAAGKAGAEAAPAGRGKGRRGGRAHDAGFVDEEGAHHGRRYRKKEDNSNVIIAVIGLVVIIALVAFFLMGTGDDPKPTDGTGEQAANASGSGDGGNGMTDTDGGPKETPTDTGTAKTAAEPTKPDTPEAGDGTDPEAKTDAPDGEPTKLTTDETKFKRVDGKKVRISKYNPPEDLAPHLESTPADKRKEIDDLINTMFDPDSGRDGFDAKKKLILIGKPAFIPVLQRMVVTKKNLKWDRSLEDNITLSSVRLADEVLREMDGWIEAKNVQRIVPGSDEKYYDYVLRIYYRRWLTELKDMEKMPGPYDPSVEYKGENEEEE
jgi:DNA-directed RNA polymerase subunit RPC12/RpoP